MHMILFTMLKNQKSKQPETRKKNKRKIIENKIVIKTQLQVKTKQDNQAMCIIQCWLFPSCLSN